MAKTKSNALKNILVLFFVALFSVSLLAVLNQVTMEPIANAEAEAKAAIYRAVYSDAADFEEITVDEIAASDYSGINAVLEAKNESGEQIGYVIDVTSPNGYGGDVQMAVGISNAGEITAFSVISQSETPGLGAKSAEAEFSDQFAGLKADTIAFSKTGANRDNNEIDAISGATITTTAVTEAVNSAISVYNNFLKGE